MKFLRKEFSMRLLLVLLSMSLWASEGIKPEPLAKASGFLLTPTLVLTCRHMFGAWPENNKDQNSGENLEQNRHKKKFSTDKLTYSEIQRNVEVYFNRAGKGYVIIQPFTKNTQAIRVKEVHFPGKILDNFRLDEDITLLELEKPLAINVFPGRISLKLSTTRQEYETILASGDKRIFSEKNYTFDDFYFYGFPGSDSLKKMKKYSREGKVVQYILGDTKGPFNYPRFRIWQYVSEAGMSGGPFFADGKLHAIVVGRGDIILGDTKFSSAGVFLPITCQKEWFLFVLRQKGYCVDLAGQIYKSFIPRNLPFKQLNPQNP